MSEKIYEEAFKYAMQELHNQYVKEGKENQFTFNFNVNYVEDSNETVTVSVASLFMKNQVTTKGSLKIIENKLREITGLNNLKVECIIKNEPTPTEIPNNDNEEKIEIQTKENKENLESVEKNSAEDIEEEKPVKNKKTHPQLRPEFTFENFIPGDNCMFAYNAALSVSKNPGASKNPILFYGGSGLGKTHLMQAIGNYIYNQNPKLKICYISAESFTNEFLNSLKTKKTEDFKNKYRNLDVLLLDDIHFLEKKEQTQEELFYTFNALFDNKKQMVFTCDRPIRETKNMADRLVSRLANGLCIDIQAPKYENRYAILQKKVDLMNKNLDTDIIDYIAKNIETNVRDLEAALMTLISYSELVDENLTLDLAKNQLKGIISNSVENISLESIEKVIAENFQISVSDLKSSKKQNKYVIPRQIAIYIARELTEISYTELGSEFHKDHSTIMHNYQKIAENIKTDPTLDSKIQIFIKQIKEFKK